MFDFLKRKNKEQHKLFYTTDVHCHILPGVDHGAQSLDDALNLVKMQMEMGITRIIATPHVTAQRFENTPQTITTAHAILQNAIKENGMDVELMCSAEYRLDEFSMRAIRENNLLPMPNDFILLENSFVQEYIGLDDLLFDFQINGLKPILAHPERYAYYIPRERQRYKDLHNAGAKFQINLLSLA
ncbi:MAG: hypothetical protein HUJ98_13215, partial [Bacteroidaceae bacterium]|nr:hypothetical protein [Bacteroidaceae bacterium]